MDPSERLESFVHQAIEASLKDKALRISLFDGVVIEGLCTEAEEDRSASAMPNATPLEERTFGPPKREIVIGEQRISVADISSLEIIDAPSAS